MMHPNEFISIKLKSVCSVFSSVLFYAELKKQYLRLINTIVESEVFSI